MREASAPKPMIEDGEREREDREKDEGRDGRSVFRLSISDLPSPPVKRRERNQS